jgi:radical SAM family protein
MRYNTFGIHMTNTCQMSCDHCITDSAPTARGNLDWDRIEPAIRTAAAHVDGVCVTGGEALIRRGLTLKTIRLTSELGLISSLVTNGYWGRREPFARRTFAELAEAGLHKLAVSYDAYHERFLGSEVYDRLLTLGADTDITIKLQYCGDGRDEAYRIAADLASRHGVELDTAEVLPFGRGSELVPTGAVDVDEVPTGPCGVVVRPVLTPEGDLFTCCGPARGSHPDSPLRLKIDTAAEAGSALKAAETDPILNVIHSHGPRRLFDHLAPATRDRIAARLRDPSLCSMCRAITDDPEAVAELTETLRPQRLRLIALSAVLHDARETQTRRSAS